MNKIVILPISLLLLSGCSESDRTVASVIGGAIVGSAISSDSDKVTGAIIGGVVGGLLSKSQSAQVSRTYNDRYVDIIQYGQTGRRYEISNFYANYDMVVYPGHYYNRYMNGYRYKCRSMDVYIYDRGHSYHSSRSYCLTNRGWMEF